MSLVRAAKSLAGVHVLPTQALLQCCVQGCAFHTDALQYDTIMLQYLTINSPGPWAGT